jgi:hypothetical protein
MRVVSEPRLAAVLGALPDVPRIVASGNFATHQFTGRRRPSERAAFGRAPLPHHHDAAVSQVDDLMRCEG